MPTLSELSRDYRPVLQAVKPGRYVYVTATHDGRRYRPFQLSLWDDDVDGELTGVLELSSRAFKDQTVFFLNSARDLGISLKVRASKGVYYLIEPRPAAQRLIAARLGLSVSDFEELVLAGLFRDLLLRDREKMKRRYNARIKAARAETLTAAAKASAEEAERVRKERQTSVLMGKLGVIHDDLFVARNKLHATEAHNRILRDYIEGKGLPLPDLRPRMDWSSGKPAELQR